MAQDAIKISIELADAAAQKALSDFIAKGNQADKSFQKLSESGKGTFNEITLGIGKSIGAYEIFEGNIAANVVLKSFELIKETASELFKIFISEGVKSAEEAQNALNSLNVALAQNGIYSKENSESFQELADHIQSNTSISKDAIVKNAALLESMAHLSKDGLERAIKAAVQLSAAYNIDLETATRSVAKAAEGHVTALQKQGLAFEIAGTKAGTFSNVLGAIEKLNGTAESKLNTFSGSVDHARNSFDEYRKVIGQTVIENPAIISAISKMSQIIDESTTSLIANKNGMTILVADGFVSLINGSKSVVEAFDTILSGFRVAFNEILGSSDKISLALLKPFIGISDTAKEEFDRVTEQAANASTTIENIYNNGGSLRKISEGLDQIGHAAEEGLGKLKSGADASSPSIQNTTSDIKKLNEEQIRAKKEIDSYVDGLAKQSDAVKTNYEQRLEQLNAFYGEKEVADTVADETNYSLKLERESQFYNDKQTARDQSLNDELKMIQQSTLLENTKLKASIAAQNKYFSDSQKMALEHDQKDKKLKEEKKKYDEQMNEYKLSSTTSLFGALGQAAALGGRKNFEIVKAFNLAEAITAGWLAVQKALASGPPPWNGVASAAAGIAAAANVSRIGSTKPPAYESGGIVGGTSWSGDHVQARVNSGEMILNRQQQTKLFEVANDSAFGSGRVEQLLANLIDAVRNQSTSISIDGREIINVVRQGLAGGRSLT